MRLPQPSQNPGLPTVIREHCEDDLAAMRACIVELQEFERRIDDRLRPGESMAGDYLAHMIGRCRECEGTILVADCEGSVAGFATVLAHVPFEELDDPPGNYALVTDLVVRDGFRRRGLASALLAEAERYARAAGATELRIGVLSGNRAAAELYRSRGFTPYLQILTKRFDKRQGSV
jgi:ribosomal protein S18 acetylase RimI-like enzyme